jgi:hypothetical protein
MAGGQLLWIFAVHLVLTGLPGVAGALFAARRGVGSVPVLLAIALAVSGSAAMLTFWAFYAEPVAGESFAIFTALGAAGLIAWALYGGHLDRGLLRQLATPLSLWALGSFFLVFFGFLHGGTAEPVAVPGTRFNGGLPTDSVIPSFYAEWFFHNGHHNAPPLFGDWLSSDRPPLQIGYVLEQRRYVGWDADGLHYQVLGTILQQLWIVGLWALLTAARVGRTTRGLAAITVLVSSVAIVNGFFVWPKMLPVAMLLAVAALVLTPLWGELRRSLWAAALIAVLLGLAMLGHGASIYGVIPLALIAAFRGLPSWRWVAVALLAGFLVFAPWSAYQKWGDPPGNRLTKWMLAGVEHVDDRGAVEAIFDSYGEVGLGGAIDNKAANFEMMLGGGTAITSFEKGTDALFAGDLTTTVREIRSVSFFNLLPSLGLLLLGPLALLAGYRRRESHPREWSLALACFAVLGLGAVVWGLLQFGNTPSRTSLHIGTYLLPVLGVCGGAVALRATFPRFAVYLLAIDAALMLAIYAPSFDPVPGTSYSLLAALLAAVGLGGFCLLALRPLEPDQGG